MDLKRAILYILLSFIGFTLYNQWVQEKAAKAPAVTQTAPATAEGVTPTTAPPVGVGSASTSQDKTTSKTDVSATKAVANKQPISIKTDVLGIKINPVGGDIASVKLLDYPLSLEDKTPVQLMSSQTDRLYILQSGLVSSPTFAKIDSPITYSAAKQSYTLNQGEKQLTVALSGKTKNGLDVVKTYVFKRGDYAVDVNYQVENNSKKAWSGSFYSQLVRMNYKSDEKYNYHAYTGASVSVSKKPYAKLKFSNLESSPYKENSQGGWIAVQQHYFLGAIIPPVNQVNHFYSQVSMSPSNDENKHVYTVGYSSPQMSLAPGATDKGSMKFYVGPEIAKKLSAVASHLELTVDYGFLWMIAVVIFWVMAKIFSVVGNWGWAIILVTLVIKLLFYPLSATSYRSMARMRKLAPRLKTLKERFGDDKKKMSQATMELYKKEKVNPLGGCLPMLIQIPVFFSLYYVIIESVQLRQAPFIWWIHDLSIRDPYYILPVLMGASMFLQQKLSPAPADETQAKVMMFLPVIFTVFFLHFPAGLVLYWLTNNLLSVAQQWWTMKNYKEPKKKKKK